MKKLLNLAIILTLTFTLISCGESSKVISTDIIGPTTICNDKIEFSITEQVLSSETGEYFKCASGEEMYLLKVKLENKTSDKVSLSGMFYLIDSNERMSFPGDAQPVNYETSKPSSLEPNETVEFYLHYDVPTSNAPVYKAVFYDGQELGDSMLNPDTSNSGILELNN